MNELVKEKFKQYAIKVSPIEACGVAVLIKGHSEMLPIKNISHTPEHNFLMDPEEYANAEELGNIVAILHSHTHRNAVPSLPDKTSCEKSKVDWYIYSVPYDEWNTLVPTGEKLNLYGRDFLWGVHDCGTLVSDFYMQEFGLKGILDYYPVDFWNLSDQKSYLQRMLDNNFHIVSDLKKYDVILMRIRAKEPNHAAIYLGNNLILHHLQNRLSSKDVYGSYFQKVTCHFLRHEKFLSEEKEDVK